ncbi:MAG: DUF1573 domain-containing protein [Flavobacteriaceae bacterium]|nr:DUF1573 domain-containing protein [Flavobacteriaceae bacterium]
MKNIFYIFLFFTLFSIRTDLFAQNEKFPILKFEQETINYGKIDSNSSGKKTFKFKNIGNAPLIIYKVKGSCGCVVLDFPKKPILPNETGEINIVYNVLKKGRISRTVTVTSNIKEKIKVLKIKGRVMKSL